MLPADETPEETEGYQGFYHLLNITAGVEQARLSYIIRDHDRERFEDRKRFIQRCAEQLNERYGEGTVECVVSDQYYNMKEKIDPQMHVIDLVLKAMQEVGISPKVKPIRGGTDGAQLSFKGLPCPNIFAGGHNFHGKLEYVPLESMMKASEVILNIITLFQAEG
jgi:tripeptide aminopeptidase